MTKAGSTMTNQAIGYQYISNGSELIKDDPKEAKILIKHGLKVLPEEGVGWFNLGLALHQDKRIKEAIRAYKHALQYVQPSDKNALINNLAQDLLLNNEFEEGWQLYENRFKLMENIFKTYIELYGPAWKGFNDERECTHLIVVAEQGYGDTLQFCRFVIILQRYGINASLFCQNSLASLLRNSTTIKDVKTSLISAEEGGKRWCPLMSLPKHLGINSCNIPLSQGYIDIDAEKISIWGDILKRNPRKKLIALHWQGNPKFEKKLYSRGRSIDPRYWNELKNIEDVEFVSIQKGQSKHDIKRLKKLNFVKGQKIFDNSLDFEDTAAVLANCDLLLSADSSVVHLSGALNIPTWVALSWVPEWRWGLNKSTTGWYDSVFLYRQTGPNNWESTIDSISKDLINL